MVGLRFENVCLQADVEVSFARMIFPGKVKWKGTISGRHGNWVGIELRTGVGTGNGCYKGVQYFSCADGYGLFVRPSQLRFPPTKGRSCSSYQRMSIESFVDERLFGHSIKANKSTDSPRFSYISNLYASDARKNFSEKESINERRNYHLGHPISSRFSLGLYNKNGPFSEVRCIQKHEVFATNGQEKPLRKLSTGLNVNTSIRDTANDLSRSLISPPSIPSIYGSYSNEW